MPSHAREIIYNPGICNQPNMVSGIKTAPAPVPDGRNPEPASAEPPISAELLARVGTVLKALGHPVRLKIIQYLATGERRVGDIQRYTGLSQPITSQQLRLMHLKGILDTRRDGNTVYYFIANDFIWKIIDCMQTLSAKVLTGEWDLGRIGVPPEGGFR